MSTTFGEEFRATRDGTLSPQNSWKMRHGHTFLGVPFDLWMLVPFHEMQFDDLKKALLAAAKEPLATDLALYFVKESRGDIEAHFKTLFRRLIDEGFSPSATTIQSRREGLRWRMSLFSGTDFPPLSEAFTAPTPNA